LGIGPNPQSRIPNPQSPIPNPQLVLFRIIKNFLDNLELIKNIEKNELIFILF